MSRFSDHDINHLKELLEKSMDSVEEELNTLLNNLIYRRDSKERINVLEDLLKEIKKELEGKK
jgi:hypothetical protein